MSGNNTQQREAALDNHSDEFVTFANGGVGDSVGVFGTVESISTEAAHMMVQVAMQALDIEADEIVHTSEVGREVAFNLKTNANALNPSDEAWDDIGRGYCGVLRGRASMERVDKAVIVHDRSANSNRGQWAVANAIQAEHIDVGEDVIVLEVGEQKTPTLLTEAEDIEGDQGVYLDYSVFNRMEKPGVDLGFQEASDDEESSSDAEAEAAEDANEGADEGASDDEEDAPEGDLPVQGEEPA